MQISTLDLLLVKLGVLELHVLVHGAFGAVRFVASSHWALVMSLNLSRSPPMTFSFIVIRQIVFIHLLLTSIDRAAIFRLICTVVERAKSLSRRFGFLMVAHLIQLVGLHAVKLLIKCLTLLIQGPSRATSASSPITYLLEHLQFFIKLVIRFYFFVLLTT